MILLQDSSQLPHLPSPRLGNLLQVARLPNPLLALEPPWKPGYLQLAPLWLPQVLNQGLSHQCTCFCHVRRGALS